jgi:hypothetical protein
MAAAKHNLIVSRGEDFSFTLTISESGSAVNLSGAEASTFKAEIRRASGKPLVASFTCAVTDAANGVVTITLPRSESLKLDAYTTYNWDIFRIKTAPSPDVTTCLIKGDLRVEGNVTDISNFVT